MHADPNYVDGDYPHGHSIPFKEFAKKKVLRKNRSKQDSISKRQGSEIANNNGMYLEDQTPYYAQVNQGQPSGRGNLLLNKSNNANIKIVGPKIKSPKNSSLKASRIGRNNGRDHQ